jgi:Asp-tRNA(Asn)/Glu-tRNA(Gln) amidotransferase A subunit family amidase
MPTSPSSLQTATVIADRVRAGAVTATAIADDHLRRIAEREPGLHAWSWHDPRQVRAQALELDARRDGLLAGVPVGVKDIIDTADMPTAYGSRAWEGHRPAADATVVRRLRDAGALIMGKTVTTEFAFSAPGPTTNPYNALHTPGGSSSGSAAAVAAGMVPLALATQTGGSTIRPAAFCGIVGFKPTHGVIPLDGVKPLAPSMDTMGLHARSVADIALLYAVLAAQPAPAAHDASSAEDTTGGQPRREGSPILRIALYPGPEGDQAQPESVEALARAAAGARADGHAVAPMELPAHTYARLQWANRTIMAVEGARAFAADYDTRRDKLARITIDLIERGRATPQRDYDDALGLAAECAAHFDRAMESYDVLLTFSAPGVAPLMATGGTGDSVFNRAWTTMGVPCLTLPMGFGPHGLPIGVQWIGARGRDRELLSSASRLEKLFMQAS